MRDGVIRWGVVGVGIAGGARVAAIRADPGAALIGGVRGRLDELGVPQRSWAELLASCDAIAVCSPDATHEGFVRRALEAGCHVVVEFPLALSRAAGAELLDLARRQQRVLHVEHIELLSGTHQAMRAAWRGGLTGGICGFEGGPGPAPAHGSIARLHRLVDLLGWPDSVEVVERTADSLRANLGFDAASVELSSRRAPGLRRATRLELRGEVTVQLAGRDVLVDGTPVAVDAGGLFAADHAAASARIAGAGAAYVSEQRILGVLGLADALAQAPVGSRVPFAGS